MPYARTAEVDVPADAFAQAKGQVRELSNAFDGEILQATADAIDWVERNLNVQLITTTFLATFDALPSDSEEKVYLAPSPLSSITSIKYYDEDDVQQNWSQVPVDYDVITSSHPGYFVPLYGEEYPSPNRDIEVIYSCGWGTAWSDVPPLVRKLVLLRTEELYRQVSLPTVREIVEACMEGDEFHVFQI